MDIDREIAAESRKQKAESRKQKAENFSDHRFICQESLPKKNCELYNSKGRSWNKQDSINGKWCCYCNYRKVFRVDVKIATTLMARDFKGFGGSSEYSNGVIEIES